MNDTDLARQLDRSFGDGPTHRPLEQQLGTGRRALRRRRVVLASGVAVAALVVVGGGALAATGGGDAARGIDPASPGRTTGAAPTDTPTSDPGPSGSLGCGLPGEEPVTLPGTKVLQRIDAPFGPDTFGFTSRYEGVTSYTYLDCASPEPAGTWVAVRDDLGTLEQWLVDTNAPQSTAPDGLVDLTTAGELVPGPGTRIVEQRDDVDLGARFADGGAPTAAARVERDGRAWWVVARHLPGGPADVFPVVGFAFDTLDDWIDHARGQYGSSSNEGLR